MKLPVRVGVDKLDKKMTEVQAMRYGQRRMPNDLKKAGFETIIFKSDPEINGSDFYRINYGKKC